MRAAGGSEATDSMPWGARLTPSLPVGSGRCLQVVSWRPWDKDYMCACGYYRSCLLMLAGILFDSTYKHRTALMADCSWRGLDLLLAVDLLVATAKRVWCASIAASFGDTPKSRRTVVADTPLVCAAAPPPPSLEPLLSPYRRTSLICGVVTL